MDLEKRLLTIEDPENRHRNQVVSQNQIKKLNQVLRKRHRKISRSKSRIQRGIGKFQRMNLNLAS